MSNLSSSSHDSSSVWPPSSDEQADDARDRQQAVGHDRLGHALRARATEGPLGRAVVAQLLAQPADAGLQLGLLRRGGTTRRLAVGPGGTGHVVRAHAGGRQGLPGAPRERILRCLRGRDPGLQGGRLIVETVAAFGQPEQGGRMQRRVRAAHDACERAGGEIPVALVGQDLAALQQAHRHVAVQGPGTACVADQGGGRVATPARGSRSSHPLTVPGPAGSGAAGLSGRGRGRADPP